MIIEDMGGRDQSQVKNKNLKSSKKVKSVPKTYQKVITMTGRSWSELSWEGGETVGGVGLGGRRGYPGVGAGWEVAGGEMCRFPTVLEFHRASHKMAAES